MTSLPDCRMQSRPEESQSEVAVVVEHCQAPEDAGYGDIFVHQNRYQLVPPGTWQHRARATLDRSTHANASCHFVTPQYLGITF